MEIDMDLVKGLLREIRAEGDGKKPSPEVMQLVAPEHEQDNVLHNYILTRLGIARE